MKLAPLVAAFVLGVVVALVGTMLVQDVPTVTPDRAREAPWALPIQAAVAPPAEVQQAQPERAPVRVEVESGPSELEQDVERWRAYAIRLEEGQPQARAARLLGLTVKDVQVLLDRSVLLSDDRHLADALTVMAPKGLSEVWSLETAYLLELSRRRSSCTAKADDHLGRQMHHDREVAPFIRAQVDSLCQRFYELNVPAQRIEGFRQRMLEDI